MTLMMSLLERVADDRLLLCAAVSVLLMSQLFVSLCAERVKGLGAGPPPDMRFGYTPEDLNAWYDALGPEGCQAYKNMYRVDLFPFMEAYAIVLGAVLLQACRTVGVDPRLSYIFPLTMYFDVVETVIPAYGCEIHPQRRLSDEVVRVAIGANLFKWISFALGMVLLTGLWLYSLFLPSPEPPAPMAPGSSAAAPEPEPGTKAPPALSNKKTRKNGKAKKS